MLLEGQIIVTLVTCSLPLEAPNALLDVTLNHAKLRRCLFLSALDLSGNLVVKFLIFVGHLVLQLSDLHLDHLVCLLDLEVGDL